jgi:hypothetical protein
MALVNPRWTFSGGIYFGCREPHLPLEFGYASALLERAGHESCSSMRTCTTCRPGRVASAHEERSDRTSS